MRTASFHMQFGVDSEAMVLEFKPCIACVVNGMIGDKQHTVKFHINYSMSRHEDYKVHDEFSVRSNEKGGMAGETKAKRGNGHNHSVAKMAPL